MSSEGSSVRVDRVVAVAATLQDGREQLGSGYLIGGRLVLTADHCTRDRVTRSSATRLRVIRADDRAAAEVVDVVSDPDLDVAVLRLADDAPWDADLDPPAFARVDQSRSGVLDDCTGIGFPLFQRDPARRTRHHAEFHGKIYQTDERESGRLLMREPLIDPGPVAEQGAEAPHGLGEAGPSSWGGLSGALMFYRGSAIGVVVEHHPRQGNSALRAIGFERIAATSVRVRQCLGLSGPGSLPYVSAYTPGPAQTVDARSIQVAAGAIPSPAEVNLTSSVHNLPRPPVRVFVGREEALRQLTEVLAVQDEAVGTQAVAVYGLGGVGKSELVLHYAHAHRNDYRLVWWITAAAGEQVEAGLAALAGRLSPVIALTATTRDAARWTAGWLQAHAGWLLILDNVEDPQDVEQLLGQLDGGHVLLTTRRDVDWRGAAVQVRLDILDSASAAEVIVRRTGHSMAADQTDAVAIATELGYLPLALDQAAAYITQARINPGSYLARLRQRPARMYAATAAGDAERTITRVWDLTITAVRGRDHGAVRLLHILACFAPHAIPRVILPGDEAAGDTDEQLVLLASYSMITLTAETVALHRLVQAVVLAKPEDTTPDGGSARGIALDWLSEAIPATPDDNMADWPLLRELVPHAEAITSRYPPGDHPGQLARIHSAIGMFYLSQGNYRQSLALFESAMEIYQTALGQSDPKAGEEGAKLRLWVGFLGLYLESDEPFAERVAAFSALCDESAGPDGYSPSVRALAADLRSRAEVMRFVLSGMGPGHRGELVSAMAAAADGYGSAGQPREALATLRRAAAFAAGGLAADRAAAQELYVRASREANAAGLVIPQAQADLALAEFELRALLDGSADHDQARLLAQFDELAAAFAAGGHAFGGALVHWAVARLLLEYGNPAGVELARDAAAGFAAADVPSSELQVWSTLRTWYTMHGEAEHVQEAEQHAARLASGLGFSPAEERVLDNANQAFRSGDVARARALLTGLASGSRGLQAASRLMLATSANAVGMQDEAKQLLEGVIADLTASGANLVLGEALAVLAALLTGEDDARVLDLLRTAASVARAAESPAEEAGYRSQLAWTMVTQRMRTRDRPFLHSDAIAEFETAERLLAGQRTLAAGGELAKLYQYRGQAAFFDTDWPQVGTWLTKAESAARRLGLLPDLAFILTYQGLALIQAARRYGPAAYDQAARLFTEAQELFRRVSVSAFVWQTGFYRALCDIEAARWPGTDDGERAARLDRASRLMEEASALIDQLRESSESGDAARQQQVWAAFSADKQTFYGEGFGLAWDARADADAAWRWLERMKGRALLDGLSDAGADQRPAVRRSQPAGYGEVRNLLAAEEAATGGKRIVVAEYLCTPQRTMVFGARADWDAPQVQCVPLDQAALRQFTAATFRQPGGVRMMMEDLGPAGLRQWDRFAPLLAPLADWAEPDDIVYLVPYGVLHDLPLHTLPISGEPLLERNPVCYVPAAAVLRHTLRGGRPGFTSGAAAVFGDSRGDLPHTLEEARMIASLLGVIPTTGDDVTRERVIRAFQGDTMLHFAGHGQLSTADGIASSLDLAGTDLLRAIDMLGQPCTARLAVLSGCDTGVGELRPGDEPVGLIRALLLSGVRSILASQWQVNDASTQDLLCRFHQTARDPTVSLAEALRRAARGIRDTPGYSHPYHWGGFTLIGSWR